MPKISFSKREVIHLVVSVSVMGFLVAINIISGSNFSFANFFLAALTVFPFALLIVAPAFVLHELGHKVVAQKFGYWAEYRMWAQGLLLAVLITIISAGRFLFIAPGAVYFAATTMQRTSSEKIGKIGLIGVLINILLSVFFGLLALAKIAGGIWTMVFAAGASINAFLAIFNLIPFPPFDGQKVFSWDKRIWAITIALAVILYATSFSL